MKLSNRKKIDARKLNGDCLLTSELRSRIELALSWGCPSEEIAAFVHKDIDVVRKIINGDPGLAAKKKHSKFALKLKTRIKINERLDRDDDGTGDFALKVAERINKEEFSTQSNMRLSGDESHPIVVINAGKDPYETKD
jgi:hypothetical protein